MSARRDGPGYWKHETSGQLRPVIEAYLNDLPMTARDIAVMRVYLRQWIDDGPWLDVEALREQVDAIHDRAGISRWLDAALEAGVDPL